MLLNLFRYDYWLDPLAPRRLLFLGVLLLAALPLLIVWARRASRDGLWRDIGGVITFARIDACLPFQFKSTPLGWLMLNTLLMLVAVINLAGLSLPQALWLLAPACALMFGPGSGPRRIATLAPYGYFYAVSLFSALRVPVDGVFSGLLYPPFAYLISSGLAYASFARHSQHDRAFVRRGALLLLAAALLWAASCAWILRTHGVTGSDPYAYVQMGVDLAERGTFAHRFPLVEQTYALGITSHPVTHLGYRIPADVQRIAPTVWPIGYAWFTAMAWKIGGESLTFLLTPLFNLASMLLTFVLTRRLARHSTNTAEIAAAALATAITATSLQQVIWQMIPMADIASQFFSLLALACVLSSPTKTRAMLAGLALGMAFNIRYTQVLIAPSLAIAIWLFHEPKTRLRHIALCAVAASVAALPLFVYHNTWFGGPFNTGSDELANFSLARMPQTLREALSALFDRREFGFLAAPMLIGIAAFWQRDRRMLAVLAAFAGALLGFHVFYDYLRIRDVLSIFPVLSVIAATGCIALWQFSVTRAGWLRAGVVFALSCALVLRSMETLALPVTRGFNAFGYLLREQRAALDALRDATEATAVIGTSLNSGAIDLHAGRLTFRPAAWTPAETRQFVAAMHAENRPVYLLLDGDELLPVESELRTQFAVRELNRFSLPYFQLRGGGSEARQVALLRISGR